MDELSRLLEEQDGVVSRRQLRSLDLKPHDVARMVRRRELAPVHAGVYVDHTGEPTWQQRAWAAVQFSWPSALTHQSALRAFEGPAHRERDTGVIHVAVEHSRHLVAPSGVRVHRTQRLDHRVQWNLRPPRVRYDEATVDVAASATDHLGVIATLSGACGSRRTTAARLLDVVDARARLPRRTWLRGVLSDVTQGACSVLEQGYLDLVERPHALPVGRRQVSHRHPGLHVYRDVHYDEQQQVVELDGRLVHDSAQQRAADLDRDLLAAVEGAETLRLSYAQVFDRGCLTAERISAVLRRRGWTGYPTRCRECG